MGTPFSQCFYQQSGHCASAVVRQHLTASKTQTSMFCYQWNMAALRTLMSCFLNCTFTSPSSLDPSHSGNPPHPAAPSPSPSGLLGPQGPCELPTKVHNAIQTIDQRTKSTFTQVEPSLKAKRHCLEGFQTPPPPPTPTPPYHRHPTQPPCQHSTPPKKRGKKTQQSPISPSTPHLSIP